MIPKLLWKCWVADELIEVWEVPDLRDDDGTRVDGLWDLDTCRVLVEASLGTGLRRDKVIVHELAHATSDIYRLGWSEETVCVIENVFGQVVKTKGTVC